MHATFTHLIGPRKGECQKFDGLAISIGRSPDNGLRFSDSERRVSSHHAEITCKGDQYILRDLGSTNGTMINGRRVIMTELKQDDLLEFGAERSSSAFRH
jgi:pSer/pThr/pTyr-binding forkhead associated (FHA) protein